MLDAEGQGQGSLSLRAGDRVELLVAEPSLARAFFHGIPVARLLGRARLASDERDVTVSPAGASASSTWDALLRKLLGGSQETRDRVRRAIARHTRVAMDEGPLAATDGTLAALVFAAACAKDSDSSLVEIAGGASFRAPESSVAIACGAYDLRLAIAAGSADPAAALYAPLFEPCVRLAARATLGPIAAANDCARPPSTSAASASRGRC